MRKRLRLSPLMAIPLVVVAACGGPPADTGGETLDAPTSAATPDPLFPVSDSGMRLEFVADPVPLGDLEMETLDGERITTADLRGKVVLVNFWATWCGPCREEVPYLVQLTERYPDHLVVIGVSEDEGSADRVRDFARQYGVNYPIVMSTPEIKHQFPGVFALPTSFIVDPEGQIVQTHVGLISPAVLEQETRYLTSLPTNVTVETVEPNRQMRLANAAQATEIPGVDLSTLSAEQRESALRRLNAEGCTCGCALTLAQCRINDSACGVSPPLVDQIVAEIAGAN